MTQKHENDINILMKENKQQITNMKTEHENQINTLTEETTHLRKEIEQLKQDITHLNQQNEEQTQKQDQEKQDQEKQDQEKRDQEQRNQEQTQPTTPRPCKYRECANIAKNDRHEFCSFACKQNDDSVWKQIGRAQSEEEHQLYRKAHPEFYLKRDQYHASLRN